MFHTGGACWHSWWLCGTFSWQRLPTNCASHMLPICFSGGLPSLCELVHERWSSLSAVFPDTRFPCFDLFVKLLAPNVFVTWYCYSWCRSAYCLSHQCPWFRSSACVCLKLVAPCCCWCRRRLAFAGIDAHLLEHGTWTSSWKGGKTKMPAM